MTNPGTVGKAVIAIADLVERTGATNFEIGYLRDTDDPNYELLGPGWHASARYRGARIFTEHHAHPAKAAWYLAARILDSGTCTHCDRETSLVGGPAAAALAESVRDLCLWWLDGDQYRRGCE